MGTLSNLLAFSLSFAVMAQPDQKIISAQTASGYIKELKTGVHNDSGFELSTTQIAERMHKVKARQATLRPRLQLKIQKELDSIESRFTVNRASRNLGKMSMPIQRLNTKRLLTT